MFAVWHSPCQERTQVIGRTLKESGAEFSETWKERIVPHDSKLLTHKDNAVAFSRRWTPQLLSQNGSTVTTRRDLLKATAGAALAVSLGSLSGCSTMQSNLVATNINDSKGDPAMNVITAKDGVQLYYKDWGKGQPIVFSHGWPLSSDDWDSQMIYFASRGYRCIAHDRRGHGRSTQSWEGKEMDTYADDLVTLTETLDLKNAIHVGHSTGGGEVAHYIGRHGQGRAKGRVAKAVLLGAVPPIMVKTSANPGGLPLEVFDGFRSALLADRAQFFLDIPSGPFYGFNRPNAKVSEGIIRNWWRQGMMCGVKAAYDCIKAFSETDFTEDLKRIDVPTLVMHGDDDQIVPIADSALLSSKLVKNATLKVYKGFPHGMATTHHEVINPDLLDFFKA